MDLNFDKQNDRQITNFIDKNNSEQFNNYHIPITLTISTHNRFQYSFRNKKGQRINLPDLIDRILRYVNCVYIPSIKNYKNIINSEFLKQIVSHTFQGWGRGRNSKKIGEQRERFQQTINELQSMLDETGEIASGIIANVVDEISNFHFSLPDENLEEFLGKLNLEVTENILQEKIDLESEGSGIQSFIIYSMLRLLHELSPTNSIDNSEYIWLIEEPETFMHNDLQRKTKNTLKEYARDGHIFISTHSPIFIDKSELDNVYYISKENSKTKMRKIEQTDLSKLLTESLGIKLQDYFLFNKYNLLVEGKSDKVIIENLIREFRIDEENIPDLEDLSIFNCRSAKSIPVFLFPASRSFRDLSKEVSST